MAKPNISLLGATYSGVAGVTLPTSGGGTATFPWVEGSETKTANGTYDVTNLAELVVNVSGGGGASNVVTGTFTASSTTGAAQTIDIPYTGNGYPNFIAIFANDGFGSGSSLYGVTHQYATIEVAIMRSSQTVAPTYGGSGTNNTGYVTILYKGNSTSNTTASRSNGASVFSTNSATAAVGTSVRMSAKNKMSVFVSSNSYGFLASATYRYVIVYSS